VCPPACTDSELLAAHRAGDAHAFGELAARYHSRLWGVAVRILHHPEDAADAVQEALVAAYRRADGYRGEATVRTWLTRILINGCIDRLRRERGHVELRLDGEPTAHPDVRTGDLATELATRLSVREALAVLPAAQRVAVVLVDVQGWSVAEVAEVLEVPVGTVKSRCARARARLAVLLGHLREEADR
jgi:RNA polymerase sigma-70 factor, ECF subfamily